MQVLSSQGIPCVLDPSDASSFNDEPLMLALLGAVYKSFCKDAAGADDDSASWPPAVKKFVEKFQDFEKRFAALSDADVVAGKGVSMNNELNTMFPELKVSGKKRKKAEHIYVRLANTCTCVLCAQRLKEDFWPEDASWVIKRFNELRKALPQRVNDVYSKQNNARAQQAASSAAAAGSGSGVCARCEKALAGDVITAAGALFNTLSLHSRSYTCMCE